MLRPGWRQSAMLASLTISVAHAASAATLAGTYRAAAGPDVASELVLKPDGRFTYFFAAGALDEQARGKWQADGKFLRLTTIPTPVAPLFSAALSSMSADAPLALLVTGPKDGGIAGVDLRIGFDHGEDLEGYTQEYGWRLPEEETRIPRWVEFEVPMYQLRSQRFPIDVRKGNKLSFVLTPNDMGTINFTGAQIDIEPGRLVLHRGDTSLVFEASDRK